MTDETILEDATEPVAPPDPNEDTKNDEVTDDPDKEEKD